MKWLHKIPQWLYIVVLFLPLIVVVPISLLSQYFILDNPEFWYGYMSYFGTVCLAIVAVWQSNDFAEQAMRRAKQLFKLQVYSSCAYFATDDVRIIKSNDGKRLKFHIKFKNAGNGNALGIILQDFEFGKYGYKIGKSIDGQMHKLILEEYGYIAKQHALEITSPEVNCDDVVGREEYYVYLTLTVVSDNQMMFDQEIQLRFSNGENGLTYKGTYMSQFFELYEDRSKRR